VIQEPNQSFEPTQPNMDMGMQGALPGEFLDEDPFGRFVQFLKKRGWIVVVTLLVGLLVGAAANRILPKLYTATATIEVEGNDLSSQFRLEQAQALTGGEDISQRLDTEIEIIRSRSLALETIHALHLESNADFFAFRGGRPWDMSNPATRELLIANFRGALGVARLGHTSIIQISVTSKRPELATLIANTLIDRYIEHSFRENYAATVKISGWLDTELNGLRAQLEKSQARILALQRDIGVYSIDQSHSIVVANLEEMNKQYADAVVDRLLKESRLQQIKGSSPDVIDAGLGGADPTLQASKQRLAQLNADYTNLAQTYGSAYPRVKALKTQIDQLERDLVAQENALVTRAQKEFDASATNEAKLRAALERQEQEAFGKGEKSMEYELARRDYETNRLLYNGLQQRLQEAGIMSGLHSTSIHAVDGADTPSFPSRPRSNSSQS